MAGIYADAVIDELDLDFSDEPLLNRIVLAAIDCLHDEDPFLVIGIGDNELRIKWDENE